MTFSPVSIENPTACAAFSALIPAYMQELDVHAGREHHPEWAPKWANSMIALQGEPCRHLELCYDNGELIGFFYGKKDQKGHRGEIRPGWGYVMEFYVQPCFRRRGYGKQMYARLEALLLADGVTQAYLTADPVTGDPFWRSVGFVKTATRSAENGLYVYEKNLLPTF